MSKQPTKEKTFILHHFSNLVFSCLFLGGGDKKILNFKTDSGAAAKPKVGSKESDIAEKQSSESSVNQ